MKWNLHVLPRLLSQQIIAFVTVQSISHVGMMYQFGLIGVNEVIHEDELLLVKLYMNNKLGSEIFGNIYEV